LQNSNKSVKIFVIDKVIDVTSLQFFIKLSYEMFFLKKYNPNTCIGSITFYFKWFSEVNSKIVVLIKFSLGFWKVFAWSLPTLKHTFFYTISFKCVTIVIKSFTNLI